MQKKLILDSDLLDITVNRLCQELIENHGDFTDTVIIGMQPRGIYLADLILEKLQKSTRKTIPLGYLDATFHRDDFRRREIPAKGNETRIPFVIEGKKVVLVDDVLFTGRSIRAALDAMIAFGRPAKVELLVLIDRKYNRDLPIAADYVGKVVNTLTSQRVLVELQAQGHKQNKIWLTNKD
ncbi:MAG TPA: bifunctional pyr operon transcriptional regulator/uracil phosphoribosyltransferase PyrR [Cyclobacteriaceae bacterium]|jgi:pyrimidine operon attenuation protein/uracil phosphoribosyltransferase|nr:bifunctional pyr operon transcriptional regulator/uracil phosphoribosyltransferase PyrR [Cyclobacteriaceae bacterium]